MKFFQKNSKKLSAILFGAMVPLLSSCVVYPQISSQFNNDQKLAKNFNLSQVLNQSDLVQSIFLTDLTSFSQKIMTITANHLLGNWLKDFLLDTKIDRGSSLFHKQKAFGQIQKQSEEQLTRLIKNAKSSAELQMQLAPYGGTKEGFLLNKTIEALKGEIISLIFERLYLSYQNNDQFYSHVVTEQQLAEVSNWNKIVFYPANYDLAIGNDNYQIMFADFQKHVFNDWFIKERPFIGCNLTWDYGLADNNQLEQIYNQTKLANHNVTLPTAPNYLFPSFNFGPHNNKGDLLTFNRWKEEVINDGLFDKNNGKVNLQPVLLSKESTDQKKYFKIYENSSLAQEKDGYFSSALVHLYNSLFDSSDQKINQLSFSNNDEKEILEWFLDSNQNQQDQNNSKIGIEIAQELFNQTKTNYASQNFVYPLRDIIVDNQKQWVLAKTKSGVSAITINGLTQIQKKGNPEEKNQLLQQILLSQVVGLSDNQANKGKNDNQLKDDLVTKLKTYAKNNFDQLLVSYAINNNSNNSNQLIKSWQNVFGQNQTEFLELLREVLKWNTIIVAQTNLTTFRNSLTQTVSELKDKNFVQNNGKYYPPYANGLATPLAFQKNLTTMDEDDPIFLPSLTNSSSPKKTAPATTKNNGDYPELTKFYTSEQINCEHDKYDPQAIIKQFATLRQKLGTWLKKLQNDNQNLYHNKHYYHLNSLEFNYTFANLLANKDNLAKRIKNLFYADHIKFDYQKNDFQGESSQQLTTFFPNNNDSSDLKSAIAQVLYSNLYTTNQLPNITNPQDFIGGFKIDHDPSNGKKNEQNYTNKISSYWNQVFYSFNPFGFETGSELLSQHIKTLLTINWLLTDQLKNFKQVLFHALSDHHYGAIVWAKELSWNDQQPTNKAAKQEQEPNYQQDYKFNPDPNGFLTSPYSSYSLTPPNSPKSHSDPKKAQNYIFAQGPIMKKNESSYTYQSLSGFYGLVTKEKTYGKQLPEVVHTALFDKFFLANPANDSSTGYLYGLGINQKEKGLAWFQRQISGIKTFQQFNTLAKKMITWFPELKADINQIINNHSFNQLEEDHGEWKESLTLKPIYLTLENKLIALKNLLNGYDYEIIKDHTNQQLLTSIKNFYQTDWTINKPGQNSLQKNGKNLFNEKKIERFIGSLQNPTPPINADIHHNKFFIPIDNNHRNGYVAYAIQINKNDLVDDKNLKDFLAILGKDAFLKTVVNLATNLDVQSWAESDFVTNDSFLKLEVSDQRIFEALGKDWAKLVN